MAKLIAKMKDGRELYGSELKDVQVKSISDFEIEMIGSTAAVDRDNEVLSIEGWDLKAYKKNPVVLEAHNYWEPAIGRAKVSIKDKQMVFRIEFPPEGVYPRADLFRKLYKLGFMKASSVGFIPSEYKMGNGVDEPRRTFLKQELTEISLVTVPANPEALLSEKSLLAAKEAGEITDADMTLLTEVVKSVAAGVMVEEKPEDSVFKSFAEAFKFPESEGEESREFELGTVESEKKVVQKKNASNNKNKETEVSLKSLLEKDPDALKETVEKAVRVFLEGEEFKGALVSVFAEIREDEKYRTLVFGDAAKKDQPEAFTLENGGLKNLITEAAQKVLKS